MRTATFSIITQRVAVISYRRFETTYRSHLQSSRIQKMKMGPTGCLETSVRNCHYCVRNNPEERSSQLLRGGSLKLRTELYLKNLFFCKNGTTPSQSREITQFWRDGLQNQ